MQKRSCDWVAIQYHWQPWTMISSFLTLAPIRTWSENCHRIIQFDNHVETPNAFVDLLTKTLFRVEISSINSYLAIHSAVLSNSPSYQSFTMARVTSQHTQHWQGKSFYWIFRLIRVFFLSTQALGVQRTARGPTWLYYNISINWMVRRAITGSFIARGCDGKFHFKYEWVQCPWCGRRSAAHITQNYYDRINPSIL